MKINKPTTTLFMISCFLFITPAFLFAQEAMRIESGAMVTVGEGAELVIQGGITLDNGCLFSNTGTIRLNKNSRSGTSWIDNTVNPYDYGTGKVVLDGTGDHTLFSKNTFGRIEVDAPGHVTLGSDITTHKLYLVNGKVNTTPFYKVIILSNTSLGVEADPSNKEYTHSWINGNLRRYISPGLVNNYIFPVGDDAKACPVVMENLTADPLRNVTYMDASFGAKHATNAGLNVLESRYSYVSMNNGGVWNLIPDAQPVSGKYDALFYFNGFTGLSDNSFGTLTRPSTSSRESDCIVPAGTNLPGEGLPGRLVTPGYARRNNMKSFGQFGIGTYRDNGLTYSNSKPVKGLNERQASVLLYPNPAYEQFTLQIAGAGKSYDAVITDQNGKILRQLKLKNNNTINITGLAAGTYIIRIPDVFGKGESFSEKVIVIR
ncbi:MAG: T9SS type A sorting domain-containing protein [Ferruginibacter sp.]|nr:T9SS type A sorting domain-containing protein [Chitinophagaceae bacterium]